MNKKTIITLLLVLVTLTGWAKEKAIVWEQPTIEYGNSNGDGFFNLALDVTKVELKETETVVYITAMQRSDCSTSGAHGALPARKLSPTLPKNMQG